MLSRFLTEPSDDGHPAIVALEVNECLATEIVVEMNLIPRLGQAFQTLVNGLNPDRAGVTRQKGGGTSLIVVKK